MRNKLFIFSVLPAIFLSVASCQKEAETETVKAIVFTNVPAKGVQISEGETFDLTYAIEPASLQETAQINWVSDDKGIASVRKGRITGVSAGKTIVRAVCEGGVEATAQVQVFPLEVTDFKIPSSLTVPRDETVKVDVSDIVPEEASVASIEWSIADESIATWEISAGALYVTGLQNGTTTLTGEGSGIARTCKITVEYIPVTAVSVKAAKTSVEIGEESYVTASITPATASNTTLSWEITPDGVIEFDAQTMKFKGTAAGQVTIKATAVKDKISGSCTVTVTEPELSVSSSDNPADCFLCPDNTFSHLNRTVQLIAKMGGKAAEGITWTSSSDEIATVSQDGLVTAKGHGVCKIYAESVTQKAGITVWSASKNGYNLILTCSSPSSATPDCYEIQEGEYIVPNTTVYSSFFDPKMFMSVDGKVQNYSQLMYPYYWNGNDMDIVTASSSGSGVTITDDGNDQISFKTASSGPASGSVTFTYKPTGYSKSVNFNVGYKSVSVFKESLAQTLYKTVKSGGSITLNKSTQSNWYIYLNATETYQTNVTGGLLKSTNYDGSTKLMTCSSNSSLYVDSSGSLKISTITNGTYTLTATRDNTCTIQVTIAN